MSSTAGARIGLWRAIALVYQTSARHWRTCLPIAAFFAVPFSIANAVSRSSTRILDPRTLTSAETAAAALTGIVSIGAMVVIALFLGSLSLGALSLVGSAAVFEDEIDARGIVRRAIDRALDAVAANLLVVVLVSIAPVVVGIIAAVVSAVSSSLGIGVLFFGTILVVLPMALYVGVHLALVIPVVMREGRGAVDALRRSWLLVRGAGLWVLGIAVVLGAGPVLLQRIAEVGIGRNGPVDFLLWVVAGSLGTILMAVLLGVGAGVVYACRAPEDVVPPDVVASEARAAQGAEARAESGTVEPRRDRSSPPA